MAEKQVQGNKILGSDYKGEELPYSLGEQRESFIRGVPSDAWLWQLLSNWLGTLC